MPYTISYDRHNELVHLNFTGEDTKEEHFHALNDACQLCSENNCRKLLIDLSELKRENPARNFIGCLEFGISVAKNLAGFKIAHVLPKVFAELKDVEFISTVENNRGVYTKEFVNFEDALNWLK